MLKKTTQIYEEVQFMGNSAHEKNMESYSLNLMASLNQLLMNISYFSEVRFITHFENTTLPTGLLSSLAFTGRVSIHSCLRLISSR